jgi:hypothetical protein
VSFLIVEPSSHEEAPLFLTYPDSSTKPSLKPETPKEEEIQPPEFSFEFEDNLFKDFGNTSNYFYQKRPPVPIGPTKPLDKTFLKETIGA